MIQALYQIERVAKECAEKKGTDTALFFRILFLLQLNFPQIDRGILILIISVLGKNVSGDFGMIPAVKQCLE